VVEELTGKLTKGGFDVYSFLESGANLSTGRSVAEEIKTFGEALANWENDPDIRRVFNAELAGLKGSDVVILLQPTGHSSLLEAGMGYGMGKRVVSIGPIEKPEVFYLICEKIYPTMDEFFADLPNFAAGQ